MLETLFQDLRFGLRMLRKNPSFSFIAILTLALGIGANTAIFSVVQTVLLAPLPYREPARLALIRQDLPKLNWSYFTVTPAEFLDYQAGNEVFSEIAGYKTAGLNLTGRDQAERVQAARVSAGLFSLLGVTPWQGRAFAPGEDQPGREQVAVLSHKLWQARFNGDPALIGQVIKLDERPYTVIGVMPPRVQFPHAGTSFVEDTELWIPLVFNEQELSQRRSGSNVGVIGRLKPGLSFEQAQASISTIAARFQQQHPGVYKDDVQVVASVHSLEREVTRRVRTLLLVLLGAVGVVLLIACANVAHLLLARGAARGRELAVRRALGASAARIIQQVLTESMLLALLGGAGGWLLAKWVLALSVKLGPEDIPRLQEAGLNASVLGFTLLVSVLTGLLFGLAPALQSTRFKLNEVLKEAGRTGSGRAGRRLRNGLVVFEAAAALLLLVGAGLLINSFVRLLRVPPGFDPQRVVAARTTLLPLRYPQPANTQAVHQQVLEKLAALPGVEAVAAASNLPLTGEFLLAFRVDNNQETPVRSSNFTLVSPDYFRVMGIPLRTGRLFGAQDRLDTPGVVVVNETLARRCWPSAQAIGQRLALGRGGNPWLTVVGVVADVKGPALAAEAPLMIYVPMPQTARIGPNVVYLARTTAAPASLLGSLRREINAVDQDLPVYDVQTLQQVLGDSIAQQRFSMVLLGWLAAVALALAALGMYGVMAYTVAQRTHELGVRMALGAARRDILKLIVGQGLRLALGGVATGLLASLALTRWLESLLFGVHTTDPLTFAGVALLLTLVALLACYVPARRATKVDPVLALRHE